MKTTFIAVSFFSLLISQAVLAEDVCTVRGVHEPNSQTYDGPTTCSGVTINDPMVRGTLTANQSTMIGIHNSYSQGFVSLKDHTLIKGKLVFQGQSGIVCIDNTSTVLDGIVNGHVSSDCSLS